MNRALCRTLSSWSRAAVALAITLAGCSSQSGIRKLSPATLDPSLREASACFQGTVTSSGVFGRPVEGATVRAIWNAGPAERQTNTDKQGQFHICVRLDAEATSLPSWQTSTKRRQVYVKPQHMKLLGKLVVVHPGFEEKTIDVAWDTSSEKTVFDVDLGTAPLLQSQK